MKFDISEIGEIHCTRISGVKGTSHFIELGNIRVLDHSIDICKKPTPQQTKVLWEVLDSYYGDALYLDLLNKNIGNFSQQYQSCNPERVMNDIISYFNNKKRVFETVKYLLNKELKENMKKNAVKINENTLRQIVAESVEKVLKEYNYDIERGDSPSPQRYLIEPMKLLLNGYKNYMSDWNVESSDISFGEYCEMLREKFEL